MDDEKRTLLVFVIIIVLAAGLMLFGVLKSSTM
jgi:hypothetical protein